MSTEKTFANFIEAVDQEIHLLKRLHYRLTVLQALVKDDCHAVMQSAVLETQEAYENLRLAELARAAAAITLTDQLELDPGVRMDEIAAKSHGAWKEIVLESRKALIENVDGVQRIIDAIMALSKQRITQTEQALEFLKKHSNSGYGDSGDNTGLLITGEI